MTIFFYLFVILKILYAKVLYLLEKIGPFGIRIHPISNRKYLKFSKWLFYLAGPGHLIIALIAQFKKKHFFSNFRFLINLVAANLLSCIFLAPLVLFDTIFVNQGKIWQKETFELQIVNFF